MLDFIASKMFVMLCSKYTADGLTPDKLKELALLSFKAAATYADESDKAYKARLETREKV